MRSDVLKRAAALLFLGSAVACSDGTGPDRGMVEPTIPITPDVPDLSSTLVGNVREFHLRAHVFKQQLETFPFKTAEVWGYNGSTPGPTAILYEGETLRFVVQNDLPELTTVHFHGLHQPNEDDGVAGVSQPNPIQPGQSYTYEFTPGHTGTFAYHSHAYSAVQELKGLDGIIIVLPRKERQEDHVDRDYAFTLQEFFIAGEGLPVVPFPPEGFNTFTMNGKTRDAASELPAKVGEKIRVRIYNASQGVHSMHEHGFDIIVVSQNGHVVPVSARSAVTTIDEGPGNFHEFEFTPDKPGKWLFHCHFPHHTSNSKMSGPDGAPVGMARVFNVTE